MLVSLFLVFQLFYSVTCSISCYNCPMEFNTFDSIITVDTIPNNLKNCSIKTEQSECSIQVIWMQNPNQTRIALVGGGEKRTESDEHNLKNDILLKNDGIKTQWTNTILYVCSTENCNSPSTLKHLLRSLTSKDNFNEFSYLLVMNEHFNGTLCFFYANSSVSCETEIDPNTCKQCTTEEYIQTKPLEICSNCIMDDVIENFITYEVKFFMNNRERHDFWMIECQLPNCNTIDNSDLIRQKSNIQFDFDLFLNCSRQLTNILSINIIVFVLLTLYIKIKLN
ncbi:unnamed protein product [Rotaria sp. Silwood1]|nr:unnamed protein product [Rotaria sp. Silwood1]